MDQASLFFPVGKTIQREIITAMIVTLVIVGAEQQHLDVVFIKSE